MIRPVLPLIEYVVYEDYISEFLCINKEKIELQCNGKCYLMQRLAEQNDQKKDNLPKIAMEEYPVAIVEFFLFEVDTDESIQNKPSLYYQNGYRYLIVSQNFHPPNFSS